MRRRLPLIVGGLALVELVLLLWIGQHIGALATFGLLAGAAVVGGVIARRQGRKALQAWQQATVSGTVPGAALGESAAVVLAGALLILPGVLSDVAAVLLLLPPVRRAVAQRVGRGIAARLVAPGGGLGGTAGVGRVLDLDPADVREADAQDESQ